MIKRILLFLLVLSLYSCYAKVNIAVRDDHSASVEQYYLESPPYPAYKRDSLGWKDTREERRKYDRPIITDFKEFYGTTFSFDISAIDSLPRYISGLSQDFIEMRMQGDSLFLFKTNEVAEKPDKDSWTSYTFVIDFPGTIRNVSTSGKNEVYWKPKKDSSKVVISASPKTNWKKKRTDLIVVELN